MKPDPKLKPKPTDEAIWPLMAAMAETTGRMVAPAIVAVGGGLWLDIHWGTRPWLTLLGAALGLAAGGWLVRRQLRRLGDR